MLFPNLCLGQCFFKRSAVSKKNLFGTFFLQRNVVSKFLFGTVFLQKSAVSKPLFGVFLFKRNAFSKPLFGTVLFERVVLYPNLCLMHFFGPCFITCEVVKNPRINQLYVLLPYSFLLVLLQVFGIPSYLVRH